MPGFLKLCHCFLPEPLLSLAGGRRKRRGGNRCNGSGGSQCACMVLIGEFSLVGSRAAIFLY